MAKTWATKCCSGTYKNNYQLCCGIKGKEDERENAYPTIIPNWDHSPRTGRYGAILKDSTPQLFQKHVEQTVHLILNKDDDHRIVILKSWNEWAEGNYVEPDLNFGRGYLEALRTALQKDIR